MTLLHPGRRTLFASLGAGVLAIGLAVGGTTAANAATNAPHPHHSASAVGHRHHHDLRGTIDTMSAGQWTLTTAKGKQVTVSTTDKTAYGTRKDPATAAAFQDGEKVIVVVHRTDGTLVANRVFEQGARKHLS